MNFFRTLLILLLLLTSPALFPQTVSSKEQITLASTEWPPYHSQYMKHQGVGTHIIKEAFNRVGIEASFVFLPWKRCMSVSLNQEVDGIATWGGWQDWIDTHYGSDPVFHGRYVLWTRKDKLPFDWENAEDIKGMRLGNSLGDSIPWQLQDAFKNESISVVRVPDEHLSRLFKMLAMGRVDIVPHNETTGKRFIKTLPAEQQEQLIPHPKSLRYSFYRVIFNKENSNSIHLWHALNTGLHLLRQEGKIKEMMDDYHRGKYEL